MAEPVGDRLARLLGLLPYLAQANRPLPITQVATHFRVSETQIRNDLRALWLVGTPGMGYDDMLQFGNYEYEDDYVDLRDARGLTRPLRLSYPEAVALSAALDALVPIVAGRPELGQVVAATLAKLAAAIHDDGAEMPPSRDVLDVKLPRPGEPSVAQAVTTALVGNRQLRIDYVDMTDQVTSRRIDPIRLHIEGPATYLVAWCRQAEGKRTFRMDRVLTAQILAAEVEHRDIGPSALDIGDDDAAQEVTITLAGPARWLVEELPTVASKELRDGSTEVTLRVHNPEWLRRLLLAQARHVRAVPPEIAADVASAARAALAQYPSD